MKTLDMIIKQPFAPHKPHSDIKMLGYTFAGSHVSIEAFVESDQEIPANRHELIAVEQEQGFNFYFK